MPIGAIVVSVLCGDLLSVSVDLRRRESLSETQLSQKFMARDVLGPGEGESYCLLFLQMDMMYPSNHLQNN